MSLTHFWQVMPEISHVMSRDVMLQLWMISKLVLKLSSYEENFLNVIWNWKSIIGEVLSFNYLYQR